MKKSQQIIGLPIISISDGNEVGKVKNIILNAESGKIDYFVVDSGIQVLSTRVIPTTNVLGIGEYAMTILNPEAISDISRIPSAIDLLQKNITVKGTKVLTKKGSLIGETGDIFVDVDNGCNIVGIEYIADITQKKVRIIPRSSVITFGKTLLVVEDDVQSRLLDDPSDLSENASDFNKETDRDFSVNTTDKYSDVFLDEVPEEPAQNLGDITEEPQESAAFEQPPAETRQEVRSSAAELFEERQRQYLRGRKSTKNIVDSNGVVLIKAGEVITDQVIDRAKSIGKLVELVMNNEA
ncbi:MAG: hypothetical protein GX045_07145 [Clostridiaceae bacterium]|jgi:uncharacterized protein YrrD|nr:hypothetical protein [Clostridiaceae bacterium]